MILLKVIQKEIMNYFSSFSRKCPILSVFKGGGGSSFWLMLHALWLPFLLASWYAYINLP